MTNLATRVQATHLWLIFGMFVYMHLRRKRIWHMQYATIYFFFLGMCILSL